MMGSFPEQWRKRICAELCTEKMSCMMSIVCRRTAISKLWVEHATFLRRRGATRALFPARRGCCAFRRNVLRRATWLGSESIRRRATLGGPHLSRPTSWR
ncbi:unnamed protein product [Heligmosomoides polygyrus]|uniref:Uncharacterized protein n=1 Tax=Heligmosomoides polygyrus TaxID=6339 RepID=A0A183GWC8_HELPZ|nr:unnamed protein product [Heligmosomoides polygyrus]